jgi:hypothetical protein
MRVAYNFDRNARVVEVGGTRAAELEEHLMAVAGTAKERGAIVPLVVMTYRDQMLKVTFSSKRFKDAATMIKTSAASPRFRRSGIASGESPSEKPRRW